MESPFSDLLTPPGNGIGFGRKIPRKSLHDDTVGTQNIAGSVISNYNSGNQEQASLSPFPPFVTGASSFKAG